MNKTNLPKQHQRQNSTGPQSVRSVSATRRVELAGIRAGDHVTISGWAPDYLEVIDTSDRALLTVRAPTGRELKIGRQCVSSILPTTERRAG